MKWFRKRLKKNQMHIMEDRNAPVICTHCGAVWDYNHDQGRCGVADATNRILAGYTPRTPRG